VTAIILPQRNRDSSFLPNYSSNNILCSSYDERIYVLDKRNMKKSVNQSKKLNGGVWKMKLHSNRDLLLCACMHTGAHLVDTTHLNSQLYYDKHGIDNLVYGCDWKPNEDIIATCSFYNHNLRIWKPFF
jgi:diphthamide biosynthesis protein 7